MAMTETLRVHLGNVVRELTHPSLSLPSDIGEAVEEASRRVKLFVARPKLLAPAVCVPNRVPLEPHSGHVNKYKLYDLTSDLALVGTAGAGLSDTELLLIQDGLRSLAHRVRHLTWMRFWGKLLGLETDYYVAEALVHGGYYYFVATERDLRQNEKDAWRELPSVTAEQIRQSRSMKKLLTGRWDAPVSSDFPGCEINLVRTLIARISANTVIAPDGYFEEKEGAIVKTAGDFDVTAVDLSSIENWKYAREFIYPSGLTTIPEDDETEVVEKLAAVNQSQFTVRLAGDRGVYNFPEGARSHGVTVMKSRKWPGAVTVASRSSWVSVYVGYGLEHGGALMPVEHPGEIQSEPAELVEQPEPYPLEDDTAKPVAEDEQ